MEIAEEAGISYAQAKRCLAYLKQLGYISSKQIRRKNKVTGQLEVSPGLRFLTPKFWLAVGLWDLFKASVAWAKKHATRFFYMPFKAINLAENTVKQVGELADNVLKGLAMTAEQEKTTTRSWWGKMHQNFRQNK